MARVSNNRKPAPRQAPRRSAPKQAPRQAPRQNSATSRQGAATNRVQQSGTSSQPRPASSSAAPSNTAAPANTAAPTQQQSAAPPAQAGSSTANQAAAARASERTGSQTPAQTASSSAQPQDKVSLGAEARQGETPGKPGEGGAVSSMINGIGEWAQGQFNGLKEQFSGLKDVAQEGLQTMKDMAQFGPIMANISKEGLTPQNMDKINGVLGKIDSPEAASKFLKEHPWMADQLRGLGEDKLNQIFNQTRQNMHDSKKVYDILGENKLGGQDHSVTTGDSWAISQAAMRDPGMRGVAQQAAANTIRKNGGFGSRIAANFVERGGRIVQNQISKRGPGMMAQQLNGSLGAMGLHGPTDSTRRSINYRELNEAAMAGQRLMGEKNPRSLNSMVQQGVWCPQPNPTMGSIQNQVAQKGQQWLNDHPIANNDFTQSALQGTINSIPQWAHGDQREGVRKYWEANGHVNHLLGALGVDGR